MARTNSVYTVHYRAWQNGEVKMIDILAHNKAEAHDIAVYEVIPAKEGQPPYSAWVSSVTYKNGNYKLFNTFEGMPY